MRTGVLGAAPAGQMCLTVASGCPIATPVPVHVKLIVTFRIYPDLFASPHRYLARILLSVPEAKSSADALATLKCATAWDILEAIRGVLKGLDVDVRADKGQQGADDPHGIVCGRWPLAGISVHARSSTSQLGLSRGGRWNENARDCTTRRLLFSCACRSALCPSAPCLLNASLRHMCTRIHLGLLPYFSRMCYRDV